MLRAFICIVLVGVGSLRAETTSGVEPPDCDYTKFPLHRSVTLRGVLSFTRYGGGRSANAPKWTTAHVLMLQPATCEFEVHAPKDIKLSQYDGFVVDITGTLREGGAAAFYTMTAKSIHRVRRYEGRWNTTHLANR